MIYMKPFAVGLLETLDAETDETGWAPNPYERWREEGNYLQWERGASLARTLLASPASQDGEGIASVLAVVKREAELVRDRP